jgi:hypothetical protein
VRRQVVLLDEADAESAPCGVAGDACAIDATACDYQVMDGQVVDGQVATSS